MDSPRRSKGASEGTNRKIAKKRRIHHDNVPLNESDAHDINNADDLRWDTLVIYNDEREAINEDVNKILKVFNAEPPSNTEAADGVVPPKVSEILRLVIESRSLSCETVKVLKSPGDEPVDQETSSLARNLETICKLVRARVLSVVDDRRVN